VLDGLHPKDLHLIMERYLKRYRHSYVDFSLWYCEDCHFTSSSSRGDYVRDFDMCSVRRCNNAVCYDCIGKFHPYLIDEDGNFRIDHFKCRDHKDPTLFDLLYRKLLDARYQQ